MRAAAALAVALACVMSTVAACGDAPATFPEEGACPGASPLPTSRATPGSVSPQGYLRRLQESGLALETLRANLRANYPEDTFYRREAFRPDFAEYASQTVCLSQAMLDLSPPDARYTKYDEAVDLTISDLIAHTRAGREAVRSRNVSEYRDWFSAVDGKVAAVRSAIAAQPGQ